MADFGVSRMLNQGTNTVHTLSADTPGWEAMEILNRKADSTCRYKTSTDIQVSLISLYVSHNEHEKNNKNETILALLICKAIFPALNTKLPQMNIEFTNVFILWLNEHSY